MLWRRIAWFTSFAVAVALAVWTRSLGFGWLATFGVAVVIWVVLPFLLMDAYLNSSLSGSSQLLVES
jgi:hypothetical protein